MNKKKKDNVVKIIAEQLDRDGYHLFINVKVNGKKCRFLIDTGASHSVIHKAFYEKHFSAKKLKTVNQATTGLHSSTSESHFGVIKELKTGKTVIKNRVLAAIDLSHVNGTYTQVKKPKIQGILGSDILCLYRMVIDYGKMQLIIPD